MRLPTLRAAAAASAATGVLLLTTACGGATGADSATGASDTADVGASDTADVGANNADAYTDGTYTAKGSYANPSGQSTITVTLKLEGNMVTDLSLKPGATGTSLAYQKEFIGGAADQVVGKSLNDVKVSKVSGSSLTSGGFNKALEQIKADAAA